MASKEVAVSIHDIHKEFTLPQSKNTSLKQVAVNIVKKNNKVTQKVLDGVSFDIHKGDFFGIVGRNGGGKSTLLKLIAGVYTPTSGSITVHGGLTPFIELGVGFNPELSGRDNVYLNGALLGFNRKQMDAKYDEIVNFAELGPFMDQKLKNYSSGMQVRLAFSIAIMAKNDVLIFDEVLAVGDEAFQAKCMDVFERYKAEGQTVILVTHDMLSVKRFCNKAVFIEDGVVKAIGDPLKIADQYSKSNREVIGRSLKGDNVRSSTDHEELYLKASIASGDKKHKNVFQYGEHMLVEIDLSQFPRGMEIESVGVSIFKKSGEHITGENSRLAMKSPIDLTKNAKLALDFTLAIKPGRYGLYIEAFSKPGRQIEAVSDGFDFIVEESNAVEWSGLVRLEHEWHNEQSKGN